MHAFVKIRGSHTSPPLSADTTNVLARFRDSSGRLVFQIEFDVLDDLAEILLSLCRNPNVQATETLVVLRTLRFGLGLHAALITVPGSRLDAAIQAITGYASIPGAYLVAGMSDFVVQYDDPAAAEWLEVMFGQPDDIWRWDKDWVPW